MSTEQSGGRRARSGNILKRALAGIAALALGIGGMVAATTAAQAAPEDIVVTINPLENLSNPGEAAVLGNTLLVSGSWDATDADPQPGDVYTIGLPDELDLGYAIGHTFVKSGPADDATIHDWAECEVTAAKTLTCTLLPAVAQYPQFVEGEFEFEVTAVGTTDSETVEFDLNGTPGQGELPGGGGITDGVVIPGEWSKNFGGWTDNERNEMRWRIEVPGSALQASGQNPVTITDTISGPHSLCSADTDQFTVTTVRGDDTAAAPGAVDFTVNNSKSFGVSLSAPFAADRTYVITYNTCTDSGAIDQTGTTYDNEADISIDGLAGNGIGQGVQDWTPPSVSKTVSNLDRANNNDSVYRWNIRASGDAVAGKNALTITDQLSGAHELFTDGGGDYELRNLAVFEYRGPGNSTNITDQLTLTPSAVTATSFTLDIEYTDPAQTFKGDFPYWYIIRYDTVSTYDGLPPSNTRMDNGATVDTLPASTGFNIPNRPLAKSGNLNESVVELGGETYLPYTTLSWNVDIAGERLNPYPGEGDQHTGSLTLTDTLDGPHEACTVGDGTLEERLGLRVHAVDQVGSQVAPFDLDATAAIGDDGEIIITIQEPAGGWDREYRYLVEYSTCTASGGMDPAGTAYGNSIEGVSGSQTDTVTQDRRGGGTGTGGAAMGSVSVSKVLSDDSAEVPSGTMFTVQVDEYAPGTSYPDDEPYESYSLQVPLNGDPVNGVNPRGNGWTFVLSEPTFPELEGVTFGAPVFTAGPGVTPINGGSAAEATITPRSNVAVTVTNKALAPSIDIEKWNDEGEDSGPRYDEAGKLLNDGYPGDFDEAPGKSLVANQPLPINFTISNDGNEDLVNVVVSDQTTGDTDGVIEDLVCTFPDESTGTTWAGPFVVGMQFECTGTLPGLENGAVHSNLATVTGIGIESEIPVDDEDPWNGFVADPSIDIEKWNDEGEGSGPSYDEAGNVIEQDYPGDFDEAPGKALEANKALPINFTISNNGDEDLIDVEVSDQLTGGTGVISDLVCTFPDESTGTTWAGPFEVGTQFECTGTLPALANGETHADTASVTGTGIGSGTKVDDSDEWNGYVPSPSIDIEKWNVETEGVGPEYDPETGALLNDGYDGDFDAPRGKPLALNTPLQINFTISNDGDEVLENIVVSDELTDGHGVIQDLVCTFPDETTGTEWAGPFEVATQFSCTGTLPGLAEGQTHVDLSKVTAIGVDSRTVVDDEDPWNGYVPGPSVDIEKWTDEGEGSGPSYDETGLLLNDGYKGDFDTAPGKELTGGKDQKINFTISNDGQEPLIDVEVSDKLIGGVGEIHGLVCTFPDGSTGTEWAGPFEVGTQFECTGTLKGLKAGEKHADKVSVSGTGLYSGIKVGDDDDWNAFVKKAEGLSVTGAAGLGGLVLGALLLVGGGALLLSRRRASAE